MNPRTTPLAIAVFARAPEPGRAKTRLIERLGADGAARLQALLTRQALTRACAVPGARVTLWMAGPIDSTFVAECASEFTIDVTPQVGADLGARMQAAVQSAHATHRAIVIIGTDCPSQTSDDLIDARTGLEGSEVVLQPALDGGYVLIGLRTSIEPLGPLFDDIEWGTDRVLDTTRARLRAAGLSCSELRARPDLDRAEDFDHALAQGWLREEAFR